MTSEQHKEKEKKRKQHARPRWASGTCTQGAILSAPQAFYRMDLRLRTIWHTARFVFLHNFLLNLFKVSLEVVDGLQETVALGVVRHKFLCAELKQGFEGFVVNAQLIESVGAECESDLRLNPAAWPSARVAMQRSLKLLTPVAAAQMLHRSVVIHDAAHVTQM